MGGILVGVLAAVRCAHQIQDLIIVVLPVCPVQAQSTLGFFAVTSRNPTIGMTGLTSGMDSIAVGFPAKAARDSTPGLWGYRRQGSSSENRCVDHSWAVCCKKILNSHLD
jgi:hypothetical protein